MTGTGSGVGVGGLLFRSLALSVALSLPLAPSIARAAEFHDGLALEGFTGLINTPNAAVTPVGSAYGLFTTQADPRFRAQAGTQTYLLSIGLLPHFEVVGRLTNVELAQPTPGRDALIRDLSANLKLQLPFHLLHPALPTLAVGTQDEGGAAPHFRTRYVVGSKALGPLRLSLGYGTGPDRMEGLFGGVEARLHDTTALLAEHDGEENHVGARVALPVEVFSVPFRLGLVAKASLDERPARLDLAVLLQAPLSLGKRGTESRLAEEQPTCPATAPLASGAAPSSAQALAALRDALVQVGFQNVRLGRGVHGALHLEYENNLFNHNEVDGLGVVLGLVQALTPAELGSAVVVMRKSDLPLLEVRASLATLRAAFAPGASPSGGSLGTDLEVRSPGRASAAGVEFLGPAANPGHLRARLIVGPGLRTFVGTEVGVFDYVLSLRPEASFSLWPGAALYARWDLPFAWSEQFEEGGAFRPLRNRPRLDHALLYQAVRPAPGVLGLVGAGIFRVRHAGLLADVAWTPGMGRHRLRLQGALMRDREGVLSTSALAGYRYFLPGPALALEVRGGRFVEGDEGATVELARFFGDTRVGLFYTRTRQQLAGIQVSLPLTPRRDMRPGLVQVTGTPRFRHSQSTVVNEERNPVTTNVAIAPETAFNLEDVYGNAGRLDVGYLRAQLPRMREAYVRWACSGNTAIAAPRTVVSIEGSVVTGSGS